MNFVRIYLNNLSQFCDANESEEFLVSFASRAVIEPYRYRRKLASSNLRIRIPQECCPFNKCYMNELICAHCSCFDQPLWNTTIYAKWLATSFIASKHTLSFFEQQKNGKRDTRASDSTDLGTQHPVVGILFFFFCSTLPGLHLILDFCADYLEPFYYSKGTRGTGRTVHDLVGQVISTSLKYGSTH